ncbi:MAG: peptidase domain-containing ABC transporter [Rhodospirillum sp.]|nr:peptidase domain-containing ABC transporter [Rhodospirillum sp.]MCF8488549.1 peptidase domain-containing ABC transporter [Rhodospirillum sp.]MCF8499145.1 peptidase domain-containing ABC transporter [Rhodospirillum sp.]
MRDGFAPPTKGEDNGWLKEVLRPLAPTFREVALMSFFVNAAALATPVFVLQVYDRVVFHAGLSTLQGLVLGMLVLLSFDFILRQSRARIMQTVALRLESQVGQRLFDKLTALPLRVLEHRPAEYWLRVFRDVDVIRNTLSGASALLLCDLPFTLLFLGLVFVIAQPVGWVLVCAAVVFMTLALVSGRSVRSAAEREKDSLGNRDSLLAELLNGRTTVKALALDRTLRDEYESRLASQVGNAINRGGRVDGFMNLGAVLSITTTIAMTTVGALAIMEQAMTIGGLIAANMLGGRLLAPLNQLTGTWRTFAGFRQSVRRLGEVLALPEDRQSATVDLGETKGHLTLEGATFRYTSDRAPQVEDITAEILPGGLTAIIGPNGGGKSTLLKVLMGLYPPEKGRVLLDGADIAQFSRADIAKRMGYLPQETTLFEGSIRDNIAMGLPELDDAAITAAAKAAGAHDMIIDLPDGYATPVGEGGRTLSGGMRQRVALARALAGTPPVILLDEPSASLDRAAEEVLRDNLSEMARTRTVVVVTHSPLLLARCQRVLVLAKGRLALAGPAVEVLPKLFPGQVQAAPSGGIPARSSPASSLAPRSTSATIQGSFP